MADERDLRWFAERDEDGEQFEIYVLNIDCWQG